MIVKLANIASGLSVELGLDTVGIIDLQDSMPLPLFLSKPGDYATKSEGDLFIEYHFLAQATLRTLIDRLRSSLQTSGMYWNRFQH
jgi:hypothetical protein